MWFVVLAEWIAFICCGIFQVQGNWGMLILGPVAVAHLFWMLLTNRNQIWLRIVLSIILICHSYIGYKVFADLNVADIIKNNQNQCWIFLLIFLMSTIGWVTYKKSPKKEQLNLWERWTQKWGIPDKGSDEEIFFDMFQNSYNDGDKGHQRNKRTNFRVKNAMLCILAVFVFWQIALVVYYLKSGIEMDGMVIFSIEASFLIAVYLSSMVVSKLLDIKKYQETWARHAYYHTLREIEMRKYIMGIGDYAVFKTEKRDNQYLMDAVRSAVSTLEQAAVMAAEERKNDNWKEGACVVRDTVKTKAEELLNNDAPSIAELNRIRFMENIFKIEMKNVEKFCSNMEDKEKGVLEDMGLLNVIRKDD